MIVIVIVIAILIISVSSSSSPSQANEEVSMVEAGHQKANGGFHCLCQNVHWNLNSKKEPLGDFPARKQKLSKQRNTSFRKKRENYGKIKKEPLGDFRARTWQGLSSQQLRPPNQLLSLSSFHLSFALARRTVTTIKK